MLNQLFMKMIWYYEGDAKRIQHFVKVHAFAKLIGEMEHVEEETLRILEAAAYVHDIGIKVAESKYGSCNGKRETPVTDPNSKRPIYLIEDQFFRFWYTFVPKNISAIQSGRMERSYPSTIENRLPDYMRLTFEKMCRDYILYYDDQLPFPLGDVGQWWGGNPKTRKQAQIDIVVTSAEDDSGIIGSCKFRESLVSEDELQLMEEYADAMGHFGHRYYYLFSKSGFTASLMNRADDVKTRLITLEEMYDIESAQ